MSSLIGGNSYELDAIADRVTYLPSAQLRSNIFSGYLDIGAGKHIHYILAESERTPSEDPVVFWTNGGPGCSGLLGFMTGIGPYRASWASTDLDAVVLEDNPYRWNKIANIVYLEIPAGTGFS